MKIFLFSFESQKRSFFRKSRQFQNEYRNTSLPISCEKGRITISPMVLGATNDPHKSVLAVHALFLVD
jgi:hypothetical protein